MTLQRRYTQRPVCLAGVGTTRSASGLPVITGYASVFYRPGDPGTEYFIDGAFERIAPTAFNSALRRDDPCALFNHNTDLVLGRVSSGTLRLSVDSVGLRYEIDPPDTSVGRDVSELLARGDVRGSSFAFIVTADRAVYDGGKLVREVTDLELLDVGPVAYPAYPASTAGVGGGRGRPLAGRAAADRDQLAVALLLLDDDV